MKTGLDDFLKQYGADEFQELPITEVKSLKERIEEATEKNYESIVREIAALKNEIEKDLCIRKLSKQLDITNTAVKKAVKKHLEFRVSKLEVDENVIIVHPSYDIFDDCMVLGFREKIVVEDEPMDRNFYVLSSPAGYEIIASKIFTYDDKKIVFDENTRYLIYHKDRWTKERINKFIKHPETPENIFQEIKDLLQKYIELSHDAYYGLLAAWIIATYFSQIYYAFPFLFLYGKKQSGKSRLLTFLERLCFNAIKVKGVSIPAMVDSVDGVRGVFLNDQAEDLSHPSNTLLRGMLTDGYIKGGGNRRIVQITNQERKVIEFQSYGPKAFASTWDIDDDLRDRCIQIVMLRAEKDYPEPEANLAIWEDLRDKLYRLALTQWQEVRSIYQTTGADVIQRVRELWRPIETALVLENVPEDEHQAIKDTFLDSMIETQSEISERDEKLFQTLLDPLLKENHEREISVEDIANAIYYDFSRIDSKERRSILTGLGHTIRQFDLATKNLGRKRHRSTYLFHRSHVENIYCRYTKKSRQGSPAPEERSILADSPDLPPTAEGRYGVVSTTRIPPIKTEDVTCNYLINKGNNYLTTCATTLHRRPDRFIRLPLFTREKN